MKKNSIILLALLLAVSLSSCTFSKPAPAADPQPVAEEPEQTQTQTETEAKNEKVFACEEMRITLTDDFTEEESINSYTGVFESSECAIFALREDKYYFDDIDLDDYAELVLEANKNAGREVGDLHRKDGIPLFEYEFTNDSTGQTFKYYTTVFESDDAFWLVQFTCYSDDYKDMLSKFHKWARSIRFEE